MHSDGNNILNTFKQLLTDNEDWLINRILGYAIKHEYSKYTSTLQEAWRLSIQGLSDSIIQMAEKFKLTIPELNPDENYSEDPASLFGIIEAKKHRERGITLSMFMGLMKYYRQCYMELADSSEGKKKFTPEFKHFITRCFDRIEIAYTSEWSEKGKETLNIELQAANRNLTNEKNKYLTIFESFYSPIFIVNDENKILNLNNRAAKLFLFQDTPGSFYYQNFKQDKHIEIFEDKLSDFSRSTLEELAFESYLNTSEGERFFLVKFKKMLDISSKFNGVIIILDDLTERKEMETQFEIAKSRAEESDHLKTAFLANMSHEIRTPMNAILGFSELLLKDTIKEPDRKEYLKLIQKSGSNLLRLIDDIIDVAKIESKQIKIRPAKFKIYELLNDLYSMFDEFIKKDDDKNIKLVLTINEPDRDKLLSTDPNRLKQIFTNLLSNSLKFTYKGFIEFGFNLVDNQNAYFYVRDSGIGIPEDKQSMIFERFIQIEGNYTKEYGGTGLGLTITRNIVDLMGGSIWVESQEGVGTTFHFVLPVNYVTEKKPELPVLQISEIKDKLPFRNHKILIAEDEEINYFYLFEILKRTGAKIIWAKNGLEAINLVESNPDIDIVLMDIKMPEINGLEAIRYLKVIRPGLPVIAQTAFVMDNDRELCIKAGCIDFISKPIHATHLIEIIQKTLITHTISMNKSKINYPD